VIPVPSVWKLLDRKGGCHGEKRTERLRGEGKNLCKTFKLKRNERKCPREVSKGRKKSRSTPSNEHGHWKLVFW